MSRARLVAYALPSLATSVTALPMALFVPAFYADELGVPLAAVGAAIAFSRLFDVVTDPLIGALSDRLHLPPGRRKAWMIAGVPVFAVGVWQVFVPGDAEGGALRLLLWASVLYLGFTMIDLPHKAWGAELSRDYDERSRITSWREALATAGQVGLLAVLAWLASQGIDDDERQLRGVALAVVLALPVAMAVCVSAVPEGRPEPATRPAPGLREGLGLVARNPAFRRMVGCVLLFVSGIAIQGTLHRLVLADVMDAESSFALMIGIENLATLCAVPVWLAVSVRIGKHRALIGAALWLALGSLPLVFFRAGDTTALIATIAVRGSSFASILFLASSMAADVIDLDAVQSGQRRSGLYFAVWGIVTKLALALGVLLGTALPAALGYDPAVPAEAIPESVLSSLMAVYGAVPALLMAAGSLFLVGFPVTRERQEELRAELEARAEAGARLAAPVD